MKLFWEDFMMSEWINVKNKLPEDNLSKDNKKKIIKVLVIIKHSNGTKTIRTQIRKYFCSGSYKNTWQWAKIIYGEVTHWMPLPELPKEE